MAVKIKLARFGKIRNPYYRVVVADARTRRQGRTIDTIGRYDPKQDPSVIEIDPERVKYWLGVGAQPTDAVLALLKVTGDWQAFKGLPAPEPMKVAAPKTDKQVTFESLINEGDAEPVKPKKAAAKKKAEPKAAEATTEAAAEEKADEKAEA